MSVFETVPVPFITVGNCQVLTSQQIAEMPSLGDFIETFKNCFEFVPRLDCYFFYPDGDAPLPNGDRGDG